MPIYLVVAPRLDDYDEFLGMATFRVKANSLAGAYDSAKGIDGHYMSHENATIVEIEDTAELHLPPSHDDRGIFLQNYHHEATKGA